MDILPRQHRNPPVARARTQAFTANAHTAPQIKTATAKRTRRFKKNVIRYALVTTNVLVIGLVSYLAYSHSRSEQASYGMAYKNTEKVSNPLDTLSAAEVAVNIAKLTGLPEELAVTNQANTIDLYLKAALNESEFVTKGQILSATIKSKKDIVMHTVQANESVASLAAQYGVTSDSIKWSNDLLGDRLDAGKIISVPPVNGFTHIVGVGDTPEKLAESFNAKVDEIIAFNDAEIGGLKLGDRIVIPGGVKQRLPALLSYKVNYGQNGYWRGYCTWYVAGKINVPNNWGNANMWDNFARLTPGWVVDTKPVVGAVAQSNYGPEGHVAIVEEVSEDGSLIKYSDMNGLVGWGREGRTPDWVPARSVFQNFIYREQ